jgi:Protein of unknown function (DUF1614)
MPIGDREWVRELHFCSPARLIDRQLYQRSDHGADWPTGQVGEIVYFFGMRYVVPVLVSRGRILAVNVGGAVIPALMSAYLLIRYDLWLRAAIATAAVAAIIHWIATPVPGLGIAVPVFVPVVSTGILALLLSREYAPPPAYIGGSMGTLIGADLLNLDKIGTLVPYRATGNLPTKGPQCQLRPPLGNGNPKFAAARLSFHECRPRVTRS